MNKIELEKALDTMTLSEIKETYKIPKTKINKLIEEYGLTVKYCGRTPYTKALIPVSDKSLVKYQDKKKREKINIEMMADSEERNWPQRDIEIRQKDIEEYDFKLGMLFSKVSDIQKEINDIIKNKNNQQFMVSIGKKTKETKDWCGYVEEERHGKRPEIKPINVEMLTNEMVLGYLSNKLSVEVLVSLTKLLKGEE